LIGYRRDPERQRRDGEREARRMGKFILSIETVWGMGGCADLDSMAAEGFMLPLLSKTRSGCGGVQVLKSSSPHIVDYAGPHGSATPPAHPPHSYHAGRAAQVLACVALINFPDVAEAFQKRHDRVLRDIDTIANPPNLGGWAKSMVSAGIQ
jgi:hypothetical protein